jgi:hypothetical protein
VILISPETMKAHRAAWYVWVTDSLGGRKKICRRATMRGFLGYDVTCSCGQFESRTGGGTRSYVEAELWLHRWQAQNDSADVSPAPPRDCLRDQEIPSTLPRLPQGI